MSIRVTGLAAFALLATACSLNPFSDKEDETDVVRSTPPPASEVRSLSGRRSASSDDYSTTASNDSYNDEPARAVPLAPNAPERYVVKRGDTLWDISATFLRDPWYWPEIWQVNPQVENPHLIYPGDILSLIYIDGQPRLMLERGIRAQRLSPQIREQRLDDAINTIAFEQIAAFLTRGQVLEKDEINRLPYMLSSRGDHLIAGQNNDIYVRQGGTGRAIRGIGARYSVVNIGDALHDPDDGDLLGYEAVYVAQGQVRREGDPATLRLIESNREAVPGDRLIDQEVEFPLNFFPKAPSTQINGQIISVVDGVSLIGQYQVVVLNRGDRHGLAEGDVLSVFQTGETIRDRYKDGTRFSASALLGGEKVKLPDERAATILVFKTYDRIAYALVMEAESEFAVLDSVRNPE
ncbi:MAG: LysM peptidoglycan-binding domain-containing protein [Pseudomonadota bacterium]